MQFFYKNNALSFFKDFPDSSILINIYKPDNNLIEYRPVYKFHYLINNVFCKTFFNGRHRNHNHRKSDYV